MTTARNSKQETLSTLLQNRCLWGDQYNHRFDTVSYTRCFRAMYNSVAQTFPKMSCDEVANVFIRNAILQIVSSFYELVNKYGNVTNKPIYISLLDNITY